MRIISDNIFMTFIYNKESSENKTVLEFVFHQIEQSQKHGSRKISRFLDGLYN